MAACKIAVYFVTRALLIPLRYEFVGIGATETPQRKTENTMSNQEELIARQAATIEALTTKLDDVKGKTGKLIEAFTKVSEGYKRQEELIVLYKEMGGKKDKIIRKLEEEGRIKDGYIESVDKILDTTLKSTSDFLSRKGAEIAK